MRIDKQKIVDYLLNREKSRGKAAFFIAFGFDMVNWEVLAKALKEQAEVGTVSEPVESAYGKRYIIDGPLETPDCRYSSPWIRTVWVEEPSSVQWRFITAYPLKRRNYD
jgi:hypothetical protein